MAFVAASSLKDLEKQAVPGTVAGEA